MISAVVVAKDHLADGGMEEQTLAGFVRAADALGIAFGDPEAFLREQQRLVFEHYAA